MAELGKIQPQQKVACPHCRSLLPDWTSEEILADSEPRCPSCGKRVRLPEAVVEKAKKSRYLGTNMDFTA